MAVLANSIVWFWNVGTNHKNGEKKLLEMWSYRRMLKVSTGFYLILAIDISA